MKAEAVSSDESQFSNAKGSKNTFLRRLQPVIRRISDMGLSLNLLQTLLWSKFGGNRMKSWDEFGCCCYFKCIRVSVFILVMDTVIVHNV